jgi:hypothetical protein
MYVLFSHSNTNVDTTNGLVVASSTNQGATWSRHAFLTSSGGAGFLHATDIVETPDSVIICGGGRSNTSPANCKGILFISTNGTSWPNIESYSVNSTAQNSDNRQLGLIYDSVSDTVFTVNGNSTSGTVRKSGSTPMTSGWTTVSGTSFVTNNNAYIHPKGEIDNTYHYVYSTTSFRYLRSTDLVTWTQTGVNVSTTHAGGLYPSGSGYYVFLTGGTHYASTWTATSLTGVTSPAPAGQTAQRIYYINGAEVLVHTGGVSGTNLFTISGVVRDIQGNPVSRLVQFYQRSNMRYIGQATSNASTGAYSFTFKNTNEMVVIAFANDAAEGDIFNDQIMRVLPG